jgi:hypothetical protein
MVSAAPLAEAMGLTVRSVHAVLDAHAIGDGLG